jgi:hypothetical protein
MSLNLHRKVMTAITAAGLVAGVVYAAPLPVKAAVTHMVYGGGPVESITDNVAVYWGSSVQAQPYFASVPGFLQALSANTSYVASLSEYSTPTQPITSLARYVGAYTITPSNTATTLQDSDIRAELNSQIAGGHLPPPTSTKNYFLMFPTGTIVCIQTNICSNIAICSYHNPMTISSITFEYIVLPDESGAGGGCGTQTNAQLGTIMASTQLVNTITDPVPGSGWSEPLVGEVADPCSPSSTGSAGVLAGFTVTKWWSNALNACVLSNPNREPSLLAVLPAMANAAYGGYTTRSYIQDTGTAATTAAIIYFDASGNLVGTGDQSTIQPNGTWIVDQSNGHSVASGQAGSALVYSTLPLASFVNEFAPGSGDATSYTGINAFIGSGTTLFAPTIVNNAYGGYTTGIGLVNVSAALTNISITYRDGAGTLVKTQSLPGVAAGAYQGLFSGDPTLALPGGFAGTATITSSAGALAAVVNETGPGGQFSSYDAVPAGSTTLFAPAALRNAYGGYNTGMGIQNTTGTAGTVTIHYYDSSGTATGIIASIAANGSLGVYQGTNIAADGAYTATITGSVPIAAIVNEVAPSTTSAQQSTAYNTFASGSATLNLPLVESTGSDGWSTGEGIMNTGTVVANVTVVYYDTSTGAMLGTPQNISLQPNAFWGLYQPTGGLPSGDRASAAVHTLGGQVAVICNESSATSFMSYSGQ